MKSIPKVAKALVFFACLLSEAVVGPVAHGQAAVGADRKVDFDVFGGLTGDYTGLNGGRNLSITVGGDINLPRYRFIRPSIEVRGTYPFVRGLVDGQKDILGGVKAEMQFGKIRPYADFLIGRGSMEYDGFPAYNGVPMWGTTKTTVLSPGVGVRYAVWRSVSVFGDAQLQHWDTPAAQSGSIMSTSLTAGASYRFAYGLPWKH